MRWSEIIDLFLLSFSSLQTLNELLASGSKEESRAAIEKQVSPEQRRTKMLFDYYLTLLKTSFQVNDLETD